VTCTLRPFLYVIGIYHNLTGVKCALRKTEQAQVPRAYLEEGLDRAWRVANRTMPRNHGSGSTLADAAQAVAAFD
jgi:hypothetical protein